MLALALAQPIVQTRPKPEALFPQEVEVEVVPRVAVSLSFSRSLPSELLP